jgi:BlaI family penicillinase repressor
MKPDDVQLTEPQLAVMRALWGLGEARTTEIVERVAARRGLAYTTVATMLSRLEKRGVVRSRQEGHERIYRAQISEAQVQRSMVSDLVSTLFRGDSAALISHLVRAEEIDEDDLERARQLLREADGASD